MASRLMLNSKLPRSFTVSANPKCGNCGKTVYAMEQQKGDINQSIISLTSHKSSSLVFFFFFFFFFFSKVLEKSITSCASSASCAIPKSSQGSTLSLLQLFFFLSLFLDVAVTDQRQNAVASWHARCARIHTSIFTLFLIKMTIVQNCGNATEGFRGAGSANVASFVSGDVRPSGGTTFPYCGFEFTQIDSFFVSARSWSRRFCVPGGGRCATASAVVRVASAAIAAVSALERLRFAVNVAINTDSSGMWFQLTSQCCLRVNAST
jgi:hypothetical protein